MWKLRNCIAIGNCWLPSLLFWFSLYSHLKQNESLLCLCVSFLFIKSSVCVCACPRTCIYYFWLVCVCFVQRMAQKYMHSTWYNIDIFVLTSQSSTNYFAMQINRRIVVFFLRLLLSACIFIYWSVHEQFMPNKSKAVQRYLVNITLLPLPTHKHHHHHQ